MSEELRHKIMTIVGIVLCVLLTPILIINCIMIVQSMINDEKVPGIGGYSPLIVLTESMEDKISAGDIIIVKETDATLIKVDESVISFFDPAGNGTSVVTHRVVAIEDKNGVLYFQTKGDNNNTEDRLWVSQDNLIGEWTGIRIPFVGHVALFMQTTGGLIVCVLVPLGLLIAYELFRRRKVEAEKQSDVDALMKELEALKAAQLASANATANTNATANATVNATATEPTVETPTSAEPKAE